MTRARGAATAAGPFLVVVAAVAASASVSRYDLRIVAVYTALTLALVCSLVVALRRHRMAPHIGEGTEASPSPLVAAALLAACGVGTWVAPTFTYLSVPQARTVKLVLAGAALVAAGIVLASRGRAAGAVLGAAVAGHITAAVLLIRLDPAPHIDVWVMLQQAADATARGQNMYTQVWRGSPGVQDAFTYLPGMGVIVAPGRWLAGDVRWALLVVTVTAALLPWLVARRAERRQPVAGPVASSGRCSSPTTVAVLSAMVLLLPGTATQVEQAWTEPVLLACLSAWYVATVRGRTRVGTAALALGLTAKQHVWPLLVVAAAWRRFGLRRVVAAAGLACAAMAPWASADPAAMWHDTVTLLVSFRALLFADTLYIAAIQELGWTPPFAVTGLVLALTLGAATWLVRRLDPPPGLTLRILATCLLVANLVNKQAFYNQYWLVMTLLLVSWMPVREASRPPDVTRPGRRPAAAAA
ncbi:MAG: hypothetical protein U0Q15_12765 [Kineosporiaceae bacterium]